MIKCLAIVVGVAGLGMATVPVRADALLDAVAAGARADRGVQWSVDRLNSDYDTAGQLKTSSVAHFNGAAAKGTRWALIAVDGKAPSSSAVQDFSKIFNAGDLAPTYAQVADLLTGAAIKVAPNCYRVIGLPAKTVMAAGYDLSPYLQADIIVDASGMQPYVSQVKISAPTPFKPMSLSKVERLDRTLTFTRGPQGMPVLSASSVYADFKVMLKKISLRSQTQFHGQRPVVQTAQLSAPGQ